MENTLMRAAILACFTTLATAPMTARADETSDLKAEVAAQKARIEALERKLDAVLQQRAPGAPGVATGAVDTTAQRQVDDPSQQKPQPNEAVARQRNVPDNYQSTQNLSALGLVLYGRVHLSYESVRIGGPTAVNHQQLQNNTSRLGVKGEREFAPGTSAFFQIESGVPTDDPNNATVGSSNVLGGRETFVGIRNKGLGEVKAGNFYHPYDDLHSISGNYFQLFTGTSNDATLWANGSSAATGGFDQRLANDAAYYTPVIGGFQGKVFYSLTQNNNNGGREQLGGNGARSISASVEYNSAPLRAAWGFEQIADARTLSTNFYERGTSNFITAGYTFGRFYLAGLAEHDRLTNINGTGRDRTRNYYHLLAKYTYGPHTLGGFYGKAMDWKGSASIADSGASMWTLGYNYQLFKDTGLYVLYTTLNNEGQAGYILGGSPARAAGAANWTPALGHQKGAVGGMFFIF
jgi:predicted porin